MPVQNIQFHSNVNKPNVSYQQLTSDIGKKPEDKSFYQENKELFWAGVAAVGIASWAILSKKSQAKAEKAQAEFFNKIKSKMHHFGEANLQAKTLEYLQGGKLPEGKHLIMINLKKDNYASRLNVPDSVDANIALGYLNDDVGPNKMFFLEDVKVIEVIKADKIDKNLKLDGPNTGIVFFDPKKMNLDENGAWDKADVSGANRKSPEEAEYDKETYTNKHKEKSKIYKSGAFPMEWVDASEKINIVTKADYHSEKLRNKQYTLSELSADLLTMMHSKDVPKTHDMAVIKISHLKDSFPNLKKIDANFLVAKFPKGEPNDFEVIEGIKTFSPEKHITKKTENENHAWIIENTQDSVEELLSYIKKD